MVGKKYWYVMYYITYQYFTLDTNIKFTSTGDRTRVACITGGQLYLKSYLDSLYRQLCVLVT